MFHTISDYIVSDLVSTLIHRQPKAGIMTTPLALYQSMDGITLRFDYSPLQPNELEIEENILKTKPGAFTTFEGQWFIPDRANYATYILGIENAQDITSEDIPDLIGVENIRDITQHQFDGLIHSPDPDTPSVNMTQVFLYWGYWAGDMIYKGKTHRKFVCHNEQGPARIYLNKIRKWHTNGKLFRSKGYAIHGDKFQAIWMHHGELVSADLERPQVVSLRNIRRQQTSNKSDFSAIISAIWRMHRNTYRSNVLLPIHEKLQARDVDFNLLATNKVFGSNTARMAFYSELSSYVK